MASLGFPTTFPSRWRQSLSPAMYAKPCKLHHCHRLRSGWRILDSTGTANGFHYFHSASRSGRGMTTRPRSVKGAETEASRSRVISQIRRMISLTLRKRAVQATKLLPPQQAALHPQAKTQMATRLRRPNVRRPMLPATLSTAPSTPPLAHQQKTPCQMPRKSPLRILRPSLQTLSWS